MSYTKHNFQSGEKLYASQLNAMDDQIALNESRIDEIEENATVNYNNLTNKPSLNGVTLSGDMTSADLGIPSAEGIPDMVDDWLDENISNPDSPPLDRSLSSSSAAAPADLVGEELASIKQDLSELAIDNNITPSWYQGYIKNASGDTGNDNNYCYSNYIKSDGHKYAITGASGYNVKVARYSSAKVFQGIIVALTSNTPVSFKIEEGEFFRIQFGLGNVATTPSSITSSVFNLAYYYMTDTGLTLPGKAADAKATGDKFDEIKGAFEEIEPIFSDCFTENQTTSTTTNSMSWTDGKYYDLNDGTEKNLSGYSLTNMFSCVAGDSIGIGENVGQVLFWNETTYLSYVATSGSASMEITAPDNATLYACNNRDTTIRPNSTTVKHTTTSKDLVSQNYNAPAKQVYTPSDFVNKHYASTSNGGLYTGDSYPTWYCLFCTPCKPSHKYRTSTFCQIVFYDSSKSFISSLVPTLDGNYATGVKTEMDFTTPEACAFISINSNSSTEMVFDLDYTKYGTGRDYNLLGKTVVCFSDSITGNYRSGDNYPYQIEQKTGALVYDVGFGGCKMELANDSNAYTNPFSMVSLADAIVSESANKWDEQDENASSFAASGMVLARLNILKNINFANVDIVTIAYGTNGIGLPLENENDPLDTYSYAGATRYAIKTLLTKYPHLRIVLLTPIYRWYSATSDDGDTHQISGQTLLDRVNKLLEVGAEIKIPTIDLYHTLGINKYNYTGYFGDDDETADGTHINSFGREQMGLRIAGELNRLF